MSVSPFPPSNGAAVPEPFMQDASNEQNSHHEYVGHNAARTESVSEPFSSANAYRTNMSPPNSPPIRTPVSSPPPRTAVTSPPPPHTASSPVYNTPNHVTYERASALHSPPLASNLVIHANTMSNAPSPTPNGVANGATTVSSATQRSDGRSKNSAAPSTKRGTASISKSARSSATSWLYGGPDSFIRVPSKMALAYIIVSTVEAIIIITLVGFIFGRIVSEVQNFSQNLKTVSVYLAVFVFGCVFQVLIAWDAVRLKNTLQLIGVLIFNIALTITAAIEIRQARDALNAQDAINGGVPCPNNPDELCRASRALFPSVERFLIAVAAVCFVAEFPMVYLSFKLWREFGWVIYQKIGADLKVRRMFFWYQMFIVFLKFSFFFGVGFTVIYLILVANTTDWEYGVTIAAVPIAMVALFAAGFAVRREWMSLMIVSLFLMIVGLVYFVYKVTQVWVPATRDEYTYVHTTITFISAFAILSLSLTLIIGVICLINFNKGLKPAHDAIGTFGGVHRHRPRPESDGNMLDVEPNHEPKEYSNGSTPHPPQHRGSMVGNGVTDPRRGSAFLQSPVYSSNGDVPTAGNMDRRGSSQQTYGTPSTAATLGNAPVHAPQPIPAALQPQGYLGAAQVPAQQPTYHPQTDPQLQNPTQAYLDAHQPKPTASRISLD